MEERQLKVAATIDVKICHVGGGDQGLLLPAFGDVEAAWPDGLKAFLYLFGLLWCFMGVAIIADVFMGAIEKITSKKTHTKDPVTGRMVTKKVWNDTVANLTLMALGSSAPEILLNVKEIFENNFYAGALGPSTIVGSAAFNLLVIMAVCVSALPNGETRKIDNLGVYCVTASFSVFAYLWLLFILMGPTPNRVDVIEGIVTFLFFPLVVGIAFLADKGKLPGTQKKAHDGLHHDASKEEVEARAHQVRKKYGQNLSDDQVAALLDYEFHEGPPHTRAYHRVAATRMLFRGKQPKDAAYERGKKVSMAVHQGQPVELAIDGNSVMSFEETEHVVLESAGHVLIKVLRTGTDFSEPCKVFYTTVDGEAKAGSDYEVASGCLEWAAGDKEPKSFDVKIFQSHETEDPEDFFVEMTKVEGVGVVACQTKSKARVMIIDENHPGKLRFADDPPERHIPRSIEDQTLKFRVLRKRGCDGIVSVTACTEEDSAVSGADFEPLEDKLTFQQGENEKSFEVTVKGKKPEGATELFRVVLKDPEGGVKFDASTDGGADSCVLTVYIEEPKSNNVFSILQVNHDQMQIGHAAWKDQFTSAICCNGDQEEEQEAAVLDWIVHFIALPWKLFFALVPPVDYFGGWLCFFVALSMIALVTILIGDLASMLGCSFGISNFATAITFVALGTSLPDTFASKTAAVQDSCADASVGNVTGSNSVNVFLGLGLPWMVAAIYWSFVECKPGDKWYMKYPEEALRYPQGAFIVKSDGLGLSVGVFSACSIVCIFTLALRRKFLGAELGGQKKTCWLTSLFFFSLWVIYIVVSIANDTTE